MAVFDPNQKQLHNRLLASLPDEEYKRLLPHLETVFLAFKQVLYEVNEPIEYVYFPKNSLVSLLITIADSTTAEVEMVGNEGLVGLPVFLGVDATPIKAMVQISGTATRMKADVFKHSVNWGSPLHHCLQRYTYALMIQISQSAACNYHHSLEQRYCRWLLRTHDGVRSEQFLLTQEFLAQMLGVRRASVTEVASRLQKAGLIRYSRGQITILDRKGLETSACKCYECIKAEYRRLFG